MPRIGIGKGLGRHIKNLGPNGAPFNLAYTISSVDLTWTNGSTNEDGISIERSTDGITYTEIATVNAGVAAYSDNIDPEDYADYYYRVRAYRGVDYSDYSNVVHVTEEELWIVYWTSRTDILLFYGQMSNMSGGELPNEMDGATDSLTVGGTEGAYTFQCPNTAAYIAADTDYIWFKSVDSAQRTPTESNMVSYDLQRTPVKYDDGSPYTIRWIAILKAGITLTATERNSLFKSFELPILWDNDLNAYGHIKDNRVQYTPYVPFKYLYKATGNEYAYVADNNALDVKTPDFTICGWVKGLSKTTEQFLFGKHIYGSVAGRYGFYTYVTTGLIEGGLQADSAYGKKTSAIDFTSGWHFLLMDTFQQPGGDIYIRLYIDNNYIGVSNLCGFNYATLDNKYEFYIGAGNNGAGSGVEIISKAAYRDIRIYHDILTTDEKTNLYNGINVPGYIARWKCDAYPLVDEVGTYNLIGVNLSASNIHED